MIVVGGLIPGPESLLDGKTSHVAMCLKEEKEDLLDDLGEKGARINCIEGGKIYLDTKHNGVLNNNKLDFESFIYLFMFLFLACS
jgi:hypothetical protein